MLCSRTFRRLTAATLTNALALSSLTLAGCEFKDTAATAKPDIVVAADTANVTPDDTTGGATDIPSFTTNPERAPVSLHSTWQRDSATTMTVSWTTLTTDTAAYQPKVWYAPVSEAGKDGAKLPYVASAFGSGYGANYDILIGDPAVLWSAELTGLQPNTEYVYRVGTYAKVDLDKKTFESPDWSEPSTFRTAPKKGDRTPYTFVMAGDSRGGTGAIRANMKREAPLVGLADIDALAWFFTGDFNPVGYQTEWNDWFDAMQPVLRGRAFMPVQGNHEVLADVYYAQFELPQIPALPAEFKEHVWSIDIGNVHFVGLDSNSIETVSAPEVNAWLVADLEAANKDPDIDWTIAMMHHPAYSACTNHGSTDRVQKYWVPIFEKNGVDLIFAGHDHDYERTKPIRNSQIATDGNAPVYIVAGAFYAPAYTNGKDWWTETSAHGNKSNYVLLQVEGKSLKLKALAGDGAEVLDEFTFTRQ